MVAAFLHAPSQNCESDYELRHDCLSVRVEQLAHSRQIFMKLYNLAFFGKSTEKIQIRLKSDKNNGYFT
jgi:hypothetical protein